MIAFFPEIYPDELLYSQLARYHSRSGYARYVFTVADIYNNEKLVHPNVDFVNRYTPDAMQWITKNEPWEVIAEQHTMYPAYIRFLPKLRRIDAVNGILSCEGNWKNLMCIPLLNERKIRRNLLAQRASNTENQSLPEASLFFGKQRSCSIGKDLTRTSRCRK